MLTASKQRQQQNVDKNNDKNDDDNADNENDDDENDEENGEDENKDDERVTHQGQFFFHLSWMHIDFHCSGLFSPALQPV